MSYSCLEELQVDLDLHMFDKTNILSKVGCKHKDRWFVVTDDGICHLFDKDGNLDDIKKITQLEKNDIRDDITKIIIPDSVTNIEEQVFKNCNGLTNVTIPDSMTSIGKYAFSDCNSLKSVTIPDNVTSIWDCAFLNCNSLMNIIIGNCMMNIGFYAFCKCSGLMSVMIGNGVTSIGYAAFFGCNKLANLTFKDKTLEHVKKMKYYPWGIEDESIIRVV